MDPKLVHSISEQIYRKFPEVAGCKPKVRLQTPSSAVGALPKSGAPTYLLTFQSTGRSSAAGSGRSIPRWVRVVVSQGGRILKVSTSR